MKPAYALVDCNNFYCSCERVFNPKLKKFPVMVLSNNDGCVIARSEEVKKLGVKMGAPYFQLKDLIIKHNIKVFSSNFSLYGDMSKRVKGVLAHFSPRIENYSIDESFLDLTEFQNYDLRVQGMIIRRTVLQWTKIPVSVGIASTKTLAKAANKVAKTNKELEGVFDMTQLTNDEVDSILEQIPVREVWGVGRQYEKMLLQNGIVNVKQLKYVDLQWAMKKMTVMGARMVRELQGESYIAFEDIIDPKKGIACTRTFGQYVYDFKALSEAVALYASRVGEKLRAQNSVACRISVFVNTNIHNPGIDQYSNIITRKMIHPTSDTSELTKYALEILKQLYIPRYKYHKAGVIVTHIIPDDSVPLDIFDERTIAFRQKRKKMLDTIDTINDKWGQNTVRMGTLGKNPGWKMNRNHLSPRYTTSWLEVPVVK